MRGFGNKPKPDRRRTLSVLFREDSAMTPFCSELTVPRKAWGSAGRLGCMSRRPRRVSKCRHRLPLPPRSDGRRHALGALLTPVIVNSLNLGRHSEGDHTAGHRTADAEETRVGEARRRFGSMLDLEPSSARSHATIGTHGATKRTKTRGAAGTCSAPRPGGADRGPCASARDARSPKPRRPWWGRLAG